ncbi:MAG TPA: hypothetical protein VKA46_15295 [Gemmataceae bacterium]|nr:hypothetical protein [Gemmataceae bacterium]
MRIRTVVAALCAAALLAGVASAAEKKLTASLKKGTPELKQAGPIAFAPEGILLVGDSLGAAVYAIDTGDRPAKAAEGDLKVEGINEKIAGLLGAEAKQVRINGLAVNPLSGNAYLSVTRGQGKEALAVLLRVNRSGKIEEVELKEVNFAKATLPNPPAEGKNQRQETITSLAYADGKVYVAGLSNEEFSSKLRAIPFPFTEADKGTSIEIYHASHQKIETNSPIRTFVPYKVNNETNLLAAYTCTPLVRVPVSDLKPGEKVKGTTIAELGNMNRPLDMIVYQKGGKDYILMANSARGVMKVPAEGIDKAKGITEPVKGGGTAGVGYETIKDLKGVEHLAKLDKDHALILVKKDGSQNLDTIELP